MGKVSIPENERAKKITFQPRSGGSRIINSGSGKKSLVTEAKNNGKTD